ncbi:MAG TPA: chromate transporter [Chloroflexota bacterium]|nr:chromate transporter [Chloroflexota bacterium]
MTIPEILLVFLKASFLSSGGLQALPILQDELIVQRNVLDYGAFATAVAIGRITPGPNGLFVITIGYYLAGLAGAIAGIVALSIPPFLAIGLVHAHRRIAHRRWVAGLTRGIGASSVGLLAALGYSFTAPLAAQPASLVILAVALGILLVTKSDALPLLVGGAAAGVALYLIGVPLA